MTQSTTASHIPGSFSVRSLFQIGSIFPDARTALATGFTVAALLAASLGARAQDSNAPAQTGPETAAPAAQQPAARTSTPTTTPASKNS